MAAVGNPESEKLSFLTNEELPKTVNKFSVDWPIVEKPVTSARIYLEMKTKAAVLIALFAV